MGKYNKYFLEARQKKRYTQPQLQRLSGVSSSQISYAETGARALRFKTAVKIAWTLGLSLDDMIRSRKSEYTPKKWSVPPGREHRGSNQERQGTARVNAKRTCSTVRRPFEYHILY